MKIVSVIACATVAVVATALAAGGYELYCLYKDFRKDVDGVENKHAKRLKELEDEYASIPKTFDTFDRRKEILDEICAIRDEIYNVVHEAGETMKRRSGRV